MRWGGGGSTASAPGSSVVAPAAQAIQISKKSLAIDGQKDIPIGSSTTVTIDLVPANFSTSSTADYKVSGDFTVTCNGVKQSSLTGAWTVTAPGLNFVATSSASFTGLPHAATCRISGDVIATRGSVSSNTLPVSATFTTVAASVCTGSSRLNSVGTCSAPPGALQDYTWNDVMKAWVANIGVLVTGANTLPDNCFLVGDSCWKEYVANGNIKFVNSGVTMTGQNTRPIVFAYYIVGGFSNGNIAAGFHNVMPMYADVEAMSPLASNGIQNGSIYATLPTIKGSATGAKVTATALTAGTTPTGTGCYERVWFASGAFAFTATTCPI